MPFEGGRGYSANDNNKKKKNWEGILADETLGNKIKQFAITYD